MPCLANWCGGLFNVVRKTEPCGALACQSFRTIAGPVADRWNRRRLIIGGNIIEGLLGATIPIAALLGVLSVAQVYAVGLLSATAFVFSDAAVFGAVPALVGTERLAAANGFLSSVVSAAEIAEIGRAHV